MRTYGIYVPSCRQLISNTWEDRNDAERSCFKENVVVELPNFDPPYPAKPKDPTFNVAFKQASKYSPQIALSGTVSLRARNENEARARVLFLLGVTDDDITSISRVA